jgi:hypothetical protein
MSGVLTDIVKGTAKVGASWLVPGSSPFISILDELRSGEFQRRFEDFREKVDEQLKMMKEVQLQQLKDNQLFATVLYIAGQLALKTNEIKRQLLANAVVNAPSCTLSEDSVVILLNCIEKYTLRHLRLLRFLQNPKEYKKKNYYMTTSTMQIYYDYYSNDNEALDRIVVKDLYADGMITTDSLFVMASVDGCLEKKTTLLGDAMIDFFGITDKTLQT